MIAVALLLALQTTAAASSTAEEADARCLAAFGALASQGTGEEVQRAAQLGGLYFYGKLVGRHPGVDLTAAMRAAARALAAGSHDELQRCSAEMQQAGAALTATGRALTATPALTPAPSPPPKP